MFRFLPIAHVGIAWCLASAAAYGQSASQWDHNGSTVELAAEGNERIFRYSNPRGGVRQVGVRSGTVLFRGSRAGRRYSGVAYVFSARCGQQPYKAQGEVSADERRITLRGNAPSGFSTDCSVSAYRDDVLQFTLLGDGKVGSVSTAAIEAPSARGDQTIEMKTWCEDSYGTLAVAAVGKEYRLYSCTDGGWAVLQNGENCAVFHPTYGLALWGNADRSTEDSLSLHRLIARRTHVAANGTARLRLVVDRNVMFDGTVDIGREDYPVPMYRAMIASPAMASSELSEGDRLWVALGDGKDSDVWSFSLAGSRDAVYRLNACMGSIE